MAEPDAHRAALIVVDVQEDFCPPVWRSPELTSKPNSDANRSAVWIISSIGRPKYSTWYQ